MRGRRLAVRRSVPGRPGRTLGLEDAHKKLTAPKNDTLRITLSKTVGAVVEPSPEAHLYTGLYSFTSLTGNKEKINDAQQLGIWLTQRAPDQTNCS